MNPVRRNRHLTVAATAATAATSWVVVTKGLGVHLGVRFPHAAASVVGLGPTVGASVAAVLVGSAVLGVLQGRIRRPLQSWTALAVAVFAASLVLPLAFATTTAATLGLGAIHLAVAAVAITGVRLSNAGSRVASDSTVPERDLLGTP
jgi:hypothetical protein